MDGKQILSGKVFNDPIHGHIEIHPLCVKIIDTPQFQRLRSIKQLGGTYFVYPGASHNRFEHSIGVCHLAGQLVSVLKAEQPELKITVNDVLCIRIAGLCHDLGHGPFSHMFDSKFLPSVGITGTKHESRSVKMFEHLVKENNLDKDFKEYFENDLDRDKKFIMELIGGPSQGLNYEGRGTDKKFLYEIVANERNGIDVDKWDYFARDCHMLGIKNSFDHTRCMKLARVVEVDEEKQICFRDKEIENLYEMFHTRDMLHRRAYQHSVGNIIEIMISEAMKKANIHIMTPGTDEKMLSISGTLDDMAAFEKLTDSIVDRIICSTDDKLKESRDILKKVKERKLYKCVGHIRKEIDETTLKNEYCLILKEIGSGLQENDIAIDVVYLHYGKKENNPIDFVRFYTKQNPNVATEVKKKEVSDLLPGKFAEHRIRFYCKRDDKDSQDEAEQALTNWCNRNNCTAVIGSQIISTTPVENNQPGGISTN